MDFVKKHYEKILLSAVLAGLVGALVFLPFIIAADKQRQDEMSHQILNPSAKPLPDLDLTAQNNAMNRVQAPCQFDFSTTNKLFNPIEWVKMPDGNLRKMATGHEITDAVIVTKIAPLNLVVTLIDAKTNELGVARYTIEVERQAETKRVLQLKTRRYVSVDDRKKDLFTLQDVKGPPDNPDQLILKLADTGELAPVSIGKPFQRVDAYAADLRYDPENLKWPGLRNGFHLRFGGDDYTVVDIKPTEVVLLAQSNQKKTSLRYAP